MVGRSTCVIVLCYHPDELLAIFFKKFVLNRMFNYSWHIHCILHICLPSKYLHFQNNLNGILQIRKGVLPRLLEEILSTRIVVKQAMKKLGPSQQVLHRVLTFCKTFFEHHVKCLNLLRKF
jgi:hypothetical protein